MKVFITKYALTEGIMEKDATLTSSSDTMIRVGSNWYVHAPYWHKTREAAVEHAKKMRDAKVKSVEKQLAKLRALTFDVDEKDRVKP